MEIEIANKTICILCVNIINSKIIKQRKLEKNKKENQKKQNTIGLNIFFVELLIDYFII